MPTRTRRKLRTFRLPEEVIHDLNHVKEWLGLRSQADALVIAARLASSCLGAADPHQEIIDLDRALRGEALACYILGLIRGPKKIAPKTLQEVLSNTPDPPPFSR